MTHRLALYGLLLATVLLPVSARSQNTSVSPPSSFDSRGITITSADSLNRVTVRFRIQSLLSATTTSEADFAVQSTNFAVRRMRLRAEGTLRDPRLRFNMQLSFARGDLDQENSGIANVLRDANISWQFTPRFALTVGQAKLPGNRQRVVSSADLQSAMTDLFYLIG